MLFITRYELKQDMSPTTVQEMLAVLAERGPSPAEVAHYVQLDGRGGTVIGEHKPELAEQQYENVLHFQSWLNMETSPVMTVEEAMPSIVKVYG